MKCTTHSLTYRIRLQRPVFSGQVWLLLHSPPPLNCKTWLSVTVRVTCVSLNVEGRKGVRGLVV